MAGGIPAQLAGPYLILSLISILGHSFRERVQEEETAGETLDVIKSVVSLITARNVIRVTSDSFKTMFMLLYGHFCIELRLHESHSLTL